MRSLASCALFLFMLVVNTATLSAQCTSNVEVLLADIDTSYAAIIVDGAVNDTLGQNGQGLCYVCLNFTHEYLADIIVDLTAPDGTTVLLIGPPSPNSANTQFSEWDICFAAAALPAAPDPGYDIVWNSLQQWALLGNYNGTYYPFNSDLGNNLENFNGGPVNGNWTLSFTDISALGEGQLISFGLVFCDDQGIDCVSCEATAGHISPDTLTYCEGDPNLEFVITPDYGANPPSNDLYDLIHVVMDNDLIASYDTLSNFTDSLPGNYQVCAISTLEASIGDLPIPDGSFGLDSITSLIDLGAVCAAINDTCYLVEILEISDTLFLFETICEGEAFNYKNVDYTQAGVYDINSSTGLCDSISILDLSVTNLIAFINPIVDPLTCNQPEQMLQGALSQSGPNAIYEWYTPDGVLVGPTNETNATCAAAGTYFLAIHDGLCHDTSTIQIFDGRVFPELTLSADTLNCNSTEVQIMLDVDVPYDQSLWVGPSFSSSDEDPLVPGAGLYYVTVATDLGCLSFDSIEVIYDSELEDPSFVVESLSCKKVETQIVSSLVNTTYDFLWTGPTNITYPDQSPVVDLAGTYQLIVTDVNACTDIHIVEVETTAYQPPININLDTITCDDPIANVSLDIDPGTEVSWSNTNGFNSMASAVDITEGGLYDIRLVSVDSCILDTFVMITIDTLFPILNLMNTPQLNCVDSVRLINDYSNVNGQSQYQWSGTGGFVSDDPNPWVFNPGIYSVTVSNPNSCSSEASVTVTIGPDQPQLDIIYTDIDCTNPSVSVTAVPSQGYSFDWSGPGGFTHMTATFTSSTAGIYIVTITDDITACQSIQSIEIMDNTADPILAISGGILDCDLNPVELSFTSDQMVLSNTWTDPNGQMSNTPTLTSMTPGWYYLEVLADTGCENKDSFEIIYNQNPPVLITQDTFMGCGVMELEINVISDLTAIAYNWSGPGGFSSMVQNPIITDLGSYFVTVTADNNCTEVSSLIVSADIDQPELVLVGLGDLDCENSSRLVGAVSNVDILSYTWVGPMTLPDESSVTINTPGTYTLTIMAANGCTNTEEFEIEAVDNLPHFLIMPDTISCLNSTATIAVIPQSGVINFNWTGPDNFSSTGTEISVTTPGEYIIEASLSTDCTTTTSYSLVSTIVEPVITNEIFSTIDCDSTEVTIGVESSHNITSYDWSGPGGFGSNIQYPVVSVPGTYTYTIQDEMSCSNTQSFEVLIDTTTAVIDIQGGNITCVANKVALSFTTNLNIATQTWSGPNGYSSDFSDPSVDVPGIYTLVVTGDNACTSSMSTEVLLDIAPPNIIAVDNSLPCNGGGVNITASSSQGQLNYKWFGPNNFYSEEESPLVMEEGQYIIFATGVNGCVGSDTLFVDDTPIPPNFGFLAPDLTCKDPQIDLMALDADDDLLVEWFGPGNYYGTGTTVNVDQSGDYLLVVTGQNGCADSSLVTLVQDTIHPTAIALSLDTLKCTLPEITLDGSMSTIGADYEPLWSSIEGNIMAGGDTYEPIVSDAGWYYLEVTNLINGCIDVDSVLVEEESNTLAGAELEVTPPFCEGYTNGTISVKSVDGGIAPYQYSFQNGVASEVKDWTFLANDDYRLLIIDAAGCTVDTLISMPQGNNLQIDLGPDTLIYFGESLTITPQINIPQSDINWISWIPSDLVDCDNCFENEVMPLVSTAYRVQMEDINGCFAEDVLMVGIISNETFYLPTAFSPNGDGVNEQYRIYGGRGVSSIESLMILDNWGNILHEAVDFLPDDPSYFWDGIYRGEPLPDGVYTYFMNYSLIDGAQQQLSGTITLLR